MGWCKAKISDTITLQQIGCWWPIARRTCLTISPLNRLVVGGLLQGQHFWPYHLSIDWLLVACCKVNIFDPITFQKVGCWWPYYKANISDHITSQQIGSWWMIARQTFLTISLLNRFVVGGLLQGKHFRPYHLCATNWKYLSATILPSRFIVCKLVLSMLFIQS